MGTAELKSQLRPALHAALANAATYTLGGSTFPTEEQTEAGLSLTVRWHNKIKITGERTQDDVGVIEGINRLVFSQDELDALELTLARLAVVEVAGLGKRFRLDFAEEGDGPHNVYWSVIEL
jgi:hypothetical protein